MKRVFRFMGVFLCAVLLGALILPTSVYAQDNSVIDISHANEGYFTVHYTAGSAVKMKVGVTYNSSTKFYSYVHGENSSFSFSEGDGDYTITLYSNVSGTSYTAAAKVSVSVKLQDELAPYLASTGEISFTKDCPVTTKAAELCADAETDAEKITAIHNYLAQNFRYDYDFSSEVTNGSVKNYIPSTGDTLESGKGICYDFAALFAAMCRSQSIPTQIQRGYLNGVYHAWNLVYLDGEWESVDLTVSIGKQAQAVQLSECLINAADGNVYTY